MKKFYKFYFNLKTNEVIAITRYAGKIIKGKAKCSSEDDFDVEIGEQLAMLRAEVKVKQIKMKNAQKKLMEADKEYAKANRQKVRMRKYWGDSFEQLDDVMKQLENLTKQLKGE